MGGMQQEPPTSSENTLTRRLAVLLLLARLVSTYVGQSITVGQVANVNAAGTSSLVVGIVCLLLALLGLTRFNFPRRLEDWLVRLSSWLTFHRLGSWPSCSLPGSASRPGRQPGRTA